MGLWVMAGSWCADHLTDGFIPDYMAERMDRDCEDHAAQLVEAGLWLVAEKGGDKGWQFHEWVEQQPTREEVQTAAAKKSSGGKLGNHRRWHVEAGKADPHCPFCSDVPSQRDRSSDRYTDRTSDRSTESVANPPTRPDPTRPVPTRPDTSTPDGVEGSTDVEQPSLAGMPEGEKPAPKQRRRSAKKPVPPVGDGSETENQRTNRIVKTYTDRVKLTDFMGARGVVHTALTCGDYSEEQVLGGLAKLAANQDPLTRNSLRNAIKPPSWVGDNDQPRSSQRGYQPWQPPADQSEYDQPFSGALP